MQNKTERIRGNTFIIAVWHMCFFFKYCYFYPLCLKQNYKEERGKRKKKKEHRIYWKTFWQEKGNWLRSIRPSSQKAWKLNPTVLLMRLFLEDVNTSLIWVDSDLNMLAILIITLRIVESFLFYNLSISLI